MVALREISDPAFQKPGRVMKYLLIWCSSGSVDILVDEHEFVLKSGTILTITSGQVHCIRKLRNARGRVLEFTFDFFCKSDHDLELIFHNGLFCHFAMNEVIPLEKGSGFIREQFQSIEQELKKRPYQYLLSIHSRIELMLIDINRARISDGPGIYKPDALFLKFLEFARASFRKNLTAREIATHLGTTDAKLNELSKLHTGKTAQNVIFGLIFSEAKRIFQYEKLSVKETAFALGFSDPFYFSNFFKKHAKVSPKEYREKHHIS